MRTAGDGPSVAKLDAKNWGSSAVSKLLGNDGMSRNFASFEMPSSLFAAERTMICCFFPFAGTRSALKPVAPTL